MAAKGKAKSPMSTLSLLWTYGGIEESTTDAKEGPGLDQKREAEGQADIHRSGDGELRAQVGRHLRPYK